MHQKICRKSCSSEAGELLVAFRSGWHYNWHQIPVSSGYVLDEPLRPTSSVMLACADTPTSTPCFIHMNCQRLKGYYPVSIELTSGARTVECYTGVDEEYAGTARGTLVDRLAVHTWYFITEDVHSNGLLFHVAETRNCISANLSSQMIRSCRRCIWRYKANILCGIWFT